MVEQLKDAKKDYQDELMELERQYRKGLITLSEQHNKWFDTEKSFKDILFDIVMSQIAIKVYAKLLRR